MSYFFSNSPLFLGLIIPSGLCVSGHVVRAIFVPDTSPKRIDQEGLGRRSSGTRLGGAQEYAPAMWTASAHVDGD